MIKRALGRFETAATITDDNFAWNLVGIARLESAPEASMLRQALAHLQEKHLFLRVRLVQEGRQYYFGTENVPPIPLEIIGREHDMHWLAIVETALNSRIDRSPGPLARCIFIAGDGGPGEIVIVFHHSIVDGASVGNLFHELLSFCASIEVGSVDSGEMSLSPAEDRFPAGFRGATMRWKTARYLLKQMGDEFRYRLGSRTARKPPIHEDARGKVLHLRVAEPLASALVRRSRNERITLNSALNAAMLMAVHKHLYGGEAGYLRYMSMVNLRPYLEPPVPPAEMGLCISMLRFTTRMSPGRAFWSLASEVNERIYGASKSGEKFIASTTSEGLMRMAFGARNFRMCTTALSFTGPSLVSSTYGPFNVRGFHGFISNFGLGPEYAAHVSLFNSEIFWDILYLDTDLDHKGAQLIADEILEILETAAGSPLAGE